MKYTSRADLLIAAGESIKMQENAGIDPIGKVNSRIDTLRGYSFLDAGAYEFPLAVVEGKPVFVGDVLYCTYVNCGMCESRGTTKFIAGDEDADYAYATWNPPKPKTVMVELLREDAATIEASWEAYPNSELAVSVLTALRKALAEK
jgi:hypothetical protein